MGSASKGMVALLSARVNDSRAASKKPDLKQRFPKSLSFSIFPESLYALKESSKLLSSAHKSPILTNFSLSPRYENTLIAACHFCFCMHRSPIAESCLLFCKNLLPFCLLLDASFSGRVTVLNLLRKELEGCDEIALLLREDLNRLRQALEFSAGRELFVFEAHPIKLQPVDFRSKERLSCLGVTQLTLEFLVLLFFDWKLGFEFGEKAS